jgi:hypothetical protein
MRLPRSRLALALGVVAVVVLAFAVTASVGLSTGGGVHLGPVRVAGPPPRVVPEIVRFDGPQAVRCPKAGAVVWVKYAYATLHSSVTTGRIDGVKRGVRRVGSPARGTMLFRYVCSGPHTIGITAHAPTGATASASIRFNKRNHAVSSTASSEVVASG